MSKIRQSFTLIELLIVIAIIVILTTAAIPIYGNLQVESQLNESSAQIIQILRTARGRSVAGLNDATHGVYFEINSGNDKYILYQGPSYTERESNYDRETTLDDSLHISTTLVDNDVNFSKGFGLPLGAGLPNAGAIILTHETSGNRTISINSLGIIKESH